MKHYECTARFTATGLTEGGYINRFDAPDIGEAYKTFLNEVYNQGKNVIIHQITIKEQ